VGNEPFFSLRKISRKNLRQAAKVLLDSMDQCVRDHKDEPGMPPPPDWLLK
jgi:hypothetical protein